MKPLTIGDWVMIHAVTEMQYNDDKQRVPVRRPCETFQAQIVGLTRRFLGRYVAGTTSSWGGWETEEASLDVKGHVRLWLVRPGLMNKELLVADSDLIWIQGTRVPLRKTHVPKFLEPAT